MRPDTIRIFFNSDKTSMQQDNNHYLSTNLAIFNEY